MLRWVRDLAGKSIEQAAKRVSVREEQVADWESEVPTKAPTVRQARELAELYQVSYLEFFRPELPVLPDPKLIPDFRLFRAAADPSETKELKSIQLWAEVQRINALDLYAEVGEAPPPISKSLFTTTKATPEGVAEKAREALNFPIAQQIGRSTEGRRQIPGELRRRIEALGILTLRRTDIGSLRVRGFCIAIFPLPIIVIGSEAPTAQVFTLAHELAHVLIRQSAISGPIPREGGDAEERRVEEWCNRFASAFLMPRRAVGEYLAPPPSPLAELPDEKLHGAALHFGVSDHAMLIRFVHLGYVGADYYWNAKKPQFDKEEAEYKGGGLAPYYGTRYRNKQGDLYTSLVLDAWSMGRITGHHAAEYMGIKNIQHMLDIRDNYGGG
jgi:Zn-dependent peptidase ImmA (M78 family)/transcriptional regulator with XRE-family HTH domain